MAPIPEQLLLSNNSASDESEDQPESSLRLQPESKYNAKSECDSFTASISSVESIAGACCPTLELGDVVLWNTSVVCWTSYNSNDDQNTNIFELSPVIRIYPVHSDFSDG